MLVCGIHGTVLPIFDGSQVNFDESNTNYDERDLNLHLQIYNCTE